MKIDTKISKQILNLIKEYDTILIFRHDSPDFDALGTQFGLYYFLKENFKDKRIYAPGLCNVEIAKNLYPINDKLSDDVINSKFLAIVCDTANTDRISDQNYAKADKIIKIDHHPNREPYGFINLVDEDQASCSEWMYQLLTSSPFKKYKISKECAKYFYSGIVGDTGRFEYNSTTSSTLEIASKLVKTGFDIVKDVYEPMYRKDISIFKSNQYVMNHYKISKNGVAYYILNKDELNELNLDPDNGKMFLSLFNYYDDIKVWCCFVEDSRKNNFRGSIRSRDIVINEVCAKFNGGGHKFASGLRVKNVDEVYKVVEELDKEVVKQIK